MKTFSKHAQHAIQQCSSPISRHAFRMHHIMVVIQWSKIIQNQPHGLPLKVLAATYWDLPTTRTNSGTFDNASLKRGHGPMAVPWYHRWWILVFHLQALTKAGPCTLPSVQCARCCLPFDVLEREDANILSTCFRLRMLRAPKQCVSDTYIYCFHLTWRCSTLEPSKSPFAMSRGSAKWVAQWRSMASAGRHRGGWQLEVTNGTLETCGCLEDCL